MQTVAHCGEGSVAATDVILAVTWDDHENPRIWVVGAELYGQ